ncbi:MAG: hypothetical protein NC419_10040 [Muribaculaceae bacterium]|nr:hypothetical protein [Muribaculaceae bacterium]
MKKLLFIATGLFTSILLSGGNITVYAQQPYTVSVTNTISTGINNAAPYSINYEWRYKIENGKFYRRLYDIRNQRWIGDWELVP